MKPVAKGSTPPNCKRYPAAKPHLLNRLGQHCSYCEVYGEPANLDVEHIYPQGAHPSRRHKWTNFLIACTSCNSKKNAYLGSGRQRGLDQRYLWPHTDNTAKAFQYASDGSVTPAAHLSAKARQLAESTMNLVGFMTRPDRAQDFDALAIAYTGASIRKDVWREASEVKIDYLANPTLARAAFFARRAATRGYFSVWMEVFVDRPEFRRELIATFKADPACFDVNTNPLPRGKV